MTLFEVIGKFKATILTLAASVMVLTGCTTTVEPKAYPVATITSGDIEFVPQGASTYAWHPITGSNYLSQEYDEQSIDAHMLMSIRGKLAERGYQEVSLDRQPDFLVGYGVAVESQLSDLELFAKTLMSTGLKIDSDDTVDGIQVEKGTVLIALYSASADPQNRWLVMSQGAVAPEFEQQGISLERIDSVTRFLEQLPKATP